MGIGVRTLGLLLALAVTAVPSYAQPKPTRGQDPNRPATSSPQAPAPPRVQPTSPAPPSQAPPPDEAADPQTAGELPVSLERIRRGLERDDTLLRAAGESRHPIFRIDVDAELPSFSAFIGEDESLSSPAPWGGMTHNEFLTMVTPPQARSYGAFTNGDLLQVLATSILGSYAMGGATALLGRVPDVIRQGREAAARREVQRTLAELERRRREEEARQKAEEAERKKAEEAGLTRPQSPPR